MINIRIYSQLFLLLALGGELVVRTRGAVTAWQQACGRIQRLDEPRPQRVGETRRGEIIYDTRDCGEVGPTSTVLYSRLCC
jgi:hypothetical protein